jgi:hypothetical protein
VKSDQTHVSNFDKVDLIRGVERSNLVLEAFFFASMCDDVAQDSWCLRSRSLHPLLDQAGYAEITMNSLQHDDFASSMESNTR